MKAQVFYGPGDLRLEEVPEPEPGPGELVVQIEAALTCGTDVKTLRRGHPVMIPRVPTVFGHELAGTVVRVGAGIRSFRDGDRVVAANSAPCGRCPACRAGRPNLCEDLLFVNGAYGERIVLPARLVETNLLALTPGLEAWRAAFVEPLACALHGIGRARITAGMDVVVLGHGPLGCLIAMAAAQRGARPVLVGKAGWRLDRVRAAAIAPCVDVTATPDLGQSLRALTGGRGPDVAVDATGRPEAWEQAISIVAPGGSVLLFGGCAPGTTVPLDTRRAHYDELTLTGAFHHTPATIREAAGLLATGAVVPDPLVTHRMGLEDVPTALGLMADGRALKVLIEPAR